MAHPEEYKATMSIVDDINNVISKHGISETISLHDLTITKNTVSDLVKSTSKLSDAITNHLWPSVESATVFHYTSRDSAESIIKNNEFRLYSIIKRFTEGEAVTFCKTHHLDGYLANDKNGEPAYKKLLMSNTFYASFTEIEISEEREEYFWRNFAQCDGVRLTINITSSNPDLRKIRYERKPGDPIALLSEISELLRKKHNRSFILKGISRLSFFYLSEKDYGIENELRLLHRSWGGGGPQPVAAKPFEYISVPLGSMSKAGYKLEVIEVHAVEPLANMGSYTFTKRGA